MAHAADAAAPTELTPKPPELPGDNIELSADHVRSVLGSRSVAEGSVVLRQAGLSLTADSLELLHPSQLAIARGKVALLDDGNRITGTEAQVTLDTRDGFVLAPRYFFARTGAGGQAERIDFMGTQQVSARMATYTSCPADGSGDPDWLLSANRLDLDFDRNDGRAEGAVLRFLGVPILAAPVLSFPANGEPRSGWLPPTIDPFDSRSGAGVALPYYWRIAPNLDATLTPTLATRRGLGFLSEFRYLLPTDTGRVQWHELPHDRSAGRSRSSLLVEQDGTAGNGLRYSAAWQSASDADYWKDFSGVLPSLTPRLLAQDLNANLPFDLAGARWQAYGRWQGWQVLQSTTDTIAPPYQRAPQLGLRTSGEGLAGLTWSLEGELNRFVLRDQLTDIDTRSNGHRAHLLGTVARPVDAGWGWWLPKLSMNAAAYRTDRAMRDGRLSASRVIPTLSLDTGLRFERDSALLGHDVRQTLEPRLHYVNTPWRNQDALPNFDAAALDFNEVSIYGDNAFSGVDYVTDAHQITLGATSRWFNRANGAELLRVGLAQRYVLRDQRITPDRLLTAGLAPESSTPATRFSDLLLFGSSTLLPNWRLDGTVQYSPEFSRTMRSILSARWQPQPFHTVSASYRYARGLSEQFELGWQWPLYRKEGAAQAQGCSGTLYGVGRVNYSMRDSRVTDSIVGVEYDAGCWIGRVVAERTSTGSTQARQHLMVQLELIGLSRIGSNPLKVLKDNIPGYQLLRDDSVASPTPTAP